MSEPNSEIRERLEREWRYIAESPKREFGGFDAQTVQLAKETLEFMAASVAQQPQPHGTIACPCLCHYAPATSPLTPNRHPEHCSQCESSDAAKQVKASAPVQEEKCKHIRMAGHESLTWCLDCGESWPNNLAPSSFHASGISEVSQPSAEPCNHEVGRTITCRLGTLGCSIHEPLPPDTNRASVGQKVAEPTRAANDPVIMVAVEASRKAFDEGRTLTVDQAFPKQAKVAEPTPKRSPAEVFFSEHSCYESRIEALAYEFEDSERDKIFAFADYFAAEQTASLRSQLKQAQKELSFYTSQIRPIEELLDAFADTIHQQYISFASDKGTYKHRMDVIKSAMLSFAKALVIAKEAAESALRSRESVAIDYTALGIQLCKEFDASPPGEDLPQFAARWLRSHDQKLRGQSVTIGRPEILEYLWREQGCPGAAQEFPTIELQFTGLTLADVIERWEKWREERGPRRESVAIDYDTEIATFNFIVSATDTDHGYDIDKAKAAVWLRKFSERVRGRESATITKLPFNCPECDYAIHDEDDAALHLIRYGPKCGRESVEKGLVEKLIDDATGPLGTWTISPRALKQRLSYRQATQPANSSEVNNG